MRIALIIPTLNAEKQNFYRVLEAISKQILQPNHVLILDSGSTDNTIAIAKSFGYQIEAIETGSFDHAGTRKRGIELIRDHADIVIFMTQDALLKDEFGFLNLVKSFGNSDISVAYGRQLPRAKASPIEAFARLFNYPEHPERRCLEDFEKYGMKVAFCSDSFAAYRIKDVLELDAFPNKSIVGEDYITVANLLLNGKSIQYCAQAQAIHSHSYSFVQEFSRYFDIGVFHKEYERLIKQLGVTEKSGQAFVKAELKYLLKKYPWLIPNAILRTLLKYSGYRLGKAYKSLPPKLVKKLSMHSFYFKI